MGPLKLGFVYVDFMTQACKPGEGTSESQAYSLEKSAMCPRILLFAKKLMLPVLPLILAACASLDGAINTWDEGDAPGVNPARLTVPADLDMMSVNGRTISNALRQGEILTYRLKPGDLQIVVRYQSRWALGDTRGEGRNGPEEEVTSDPVQITFNADPGADYRLAFAPPADRKAAKRLARDFSAGLVAAGGDILAKSKAVESPQAQPAIRTNLQFKGEKTVQAAAPKLAGRESGQPKVGGGTRMSPSERLKVMKDNWAEASQETREAFLKWAL